VITPSLPTFFVASPMILPIALSPLVEIVPTWAISSEDCTLLARQQAAFGAGASGEPWARSARGLVVQHGEAILKGVKAYSLPIARKGAANGGGGKLKWLSRKRPLGPVSRQALDFAFYQPRRASRRPHSLRLSARQFNHAR